MSLILSVLFYEVTVLTLLWIFCKLTLGRCTSRQDMTGKTVLITGASAGIGKATAFDLARRNARVLLACRNLEKAERVRSEIISETGNENVEVKHLQLTSFASVRKCAEDVLRTEKRLDVLINNAGTTGNDIVFTEDGCESILQSNHLGHFLLTLLLLDLLKKSKPSRIINVSSFLYPLAFLDLDDLKCTARVSQILAKHAGNLYCRTKLANILFTTELARRLDGSGVTVNALHPGTIVSNIYFKYKHAFLSVFTFFVYIFGKSVEEGAQTTIYLAVDPEVEKTTGKYFRDCKESTLFGQASSQELARKLFELSEKTVGEYYPKTSEE